LSFMASFYTKGEADNSSLRTSDCSLSTVAFDCPIRLFTVNQ
jgi:hypothetical protein